jgi:ABC-type branched-subunit amino acid transport system ATPase component
VSKPVLSIDTACKFFGGVKAVTNVSFDVEASKITSVIGPNGAGKTTLFNCITGIYNPTSGQIMFRGNKPDFTDITAWRPDRVAYQGISRTFQNIRLFKTLTVMQNVKLGFHPRTHAGVLGALLPLPTSRREERQISLAALKCLDFVGLANKAGHQAGDLAYGDQRRVEIARALASSPSLLLLDEPAAGMNPQETEDLMALIRKILDAGITVILIEHDMKLVMKISDSVFVLDHGELIAGGGPEEVSGNPKVVEAYLGVQE